MKRVVEKLLSSNDVGKTGTHQAGILIPKKSDLLDFFPQLDYEAENPRVTIRFIDEKNQVWKFNYIYYNNKLRGGTRNEFRLTGMTAFFKQSGAKEGDVLVFEKDEDNYLIRISDSDKYCEENGIVSLVLDDKWKVIKF